MVHVALPKWPIHFYCKLDQQSRQQALRAYCHNIYTVAQWLCSGGWSQWVPKTCVKNHRKVVKLQLKQMCSDNNNIFVRAAQLDARNDGLSELCPSHLLLLNLSAKFPVFLNKFFRQYNFMFLLVTSNFESILNFTHYFTLNESYLIFLVRIIIFNVFNYLSQKTFQL